MYYEGKIEKITVTGANKTFTVHFKNYGKNQDQVFSFNEAKSSFLPHTQQSIKYMKKHNMDLKSLALEISLQEREMIVEDGEEHVAPIKQKKTLPEISLHCTESLRTLGEIDDNGKIVTRFPPRYCFEEIVKDFQESTNMFNYFNEVTLDFFCSSFESSYMFSSRQTDAVYEKNAALGYYMKICRSRGIPSPSHEEIDVRTQIFGKWKPDLSCRYLYGVTHLVRYLLYLYQMHYDIESERRLDDKEEEILVLVTNLAHFIYQRREQYFCDGRDFTRPCVNLMN
uniref:MRG domain-containing protein n=1 Tax=Panagrolaimus sp. ES5 TaxID=591445 RepID=A0AC34FMQ6_9BILA